MMKKNILLSRNRFSVSPFGTSSAFFVASVLGIAPAFCAATTISTSTSSTPAVSSSSIEGAARPDLFGRAIPRNPADSLSATSSETTAPAGPLGTETAWSVEDVLAYSEQASKSSAARAEGGPNTAAAQAQGEAATNVSVSVLVSFSMPEASLRRLARDARDARVPLVFAGVPAGNASEGTSGEEKPREEKTAAQKPILNPQSLAAFEPLIALGASVELNPELFADYGIREVPVLLMVQNRPERGACEDTAAALAVPGDVTLGYALDRIVDREDAFGEKARRLRRLLGGRE